MSRRSRRDPSVFNEPQFSGRPFKPDPRDMPIVNPRPASDDPDLAVWDDPTYSTELAGPQPEGVLNYSNWLRCNRASTSAAKSWLVTLLVVLSAGPWAILGALFQGQGALGLWGVVVLGPLVEEACKIAIAFYVIERRPYLFRSSIQILLAAIAGGLVFAAIENLIYLHVYVPNPEPWLIKWRWTFCVLLHASCSMIAGIGLIVAWQDLWRRKNRPRLTLAFPWWIVAMVVHGIYNAVVSLLPEEMLH